MGNKMLVMQALDERNMLVKKINSKIRKANFTDVIKNNQEKVMYMQISREEYKKQAEASYNQIMDLIARYQKIDAAIIASNAQTHIKTSYGTFSISEALSLKRRIMSKDKSTGDNRTDFESYLYVKVQLKYEECMREISEKNSILMNTAETMSLSILGKDSKGKDDKPLEVVDVYVRENTAELVDPLDIKKKVAALDEKCVMLLAEIDTGIKVSDATTFIEI